MQFKVLIFQYERIVSSIASIREQTDVQRPKIIDMFLGKIQLYLFEPEFKIMT